MQLVRVQQLLQIKNVSRGWAPRWQDIRPADRCLPGFRKGRFRKNIFKNPF